MRKKILVMVLLFALLVLSGCGIKLTSKVNIDENFSGTRTMTCTFSTSDFQHFFNGSQKDLDQTIKDTCPSQLSYKKTSDDRDTIYTFSLKFSSLDDYREKVGKILNFSPKITWQYGDSPFVSGLIYQENFSSTDLMTWLYTALYEENYVDKDSAEQLLDLKETTISAAGKTYTTANKISIDEMSYRELSSIEIETVPQKDGSLKRTISFYIPRNTLEQNSGKIEKYFKDQDPSWSNWSDGKILNITFTADQFSDLSAKTRSVLHSDSSYGTYTVNCKEDDPFSFDLTYRESLDFSNFIQKNGKVPVTYTFDGKKILDDDVKTKSLEFSSSGKQEIDSYQIITIWNSASDIRRKFSFTFVPSGTNLMLTRMKQAINGDTVSNVETTEEDGKTTLSFLQQGSVKACSDDLSKIFSQSSMTADSKTSLFKGKSTTFEDQFAFSSGNKAIEGTYIFASINSDESCTLNLAPKEAVTDTKKQGLSNREVSRLLKSDETIHDFSQFTLTGDKLKLSYKGSQTASHWMSNLKILVPFLCFFIVALFIFIRQKWIAAQVIRLKEKAEEWINKKRN